MIIESFKQDRCCNGGDVDFDNLLRVNTRPVLVYQKSVTLITKKKKNFSKTSLVVFHFDSFFDHLVVIIKSFDFLISRQLGYINYGTVR